MKKKEYHENLREEYRQINLWLRHQEITWWGIAVVLFSLTAGSIFISITTLQFWPRCTLGVTNILIWMGYMFYTKYMLMKGYNWLKRIKVIEIEIGAKFINEDGKLKENQIEEFLNDFFPSTSKSLPKSVGLCQKIDIKSRFFHLLRIIIPYIISLIQLLINKFLRLLYKHIFLSDIRFDKVMIFIWVLIIILWILICFCPIFQIKEKEIHNEKEKFKTEFHQWNFKSK